MLRTTALLAALAAPVAATAQDLPTSPYLPLAMASDAANAALAAARALLRHTEMSAREITEEALRIASEICVFTNDRLTIEEI